MILILRRLILLQWAFFFQAQLCEAHAGPSFDPTGYRKCISTASRTFAHRFNPQYPHFLGDVNERCSTENFVDRELLGEGGTSLVFSAIYVPRAQRVALKVLKMPSQDLANEECFLYHIKHHNVPQYYCSFVEAYKAVLVMELIEGRDLADLAEESKKCDLEAAQRSLQWPRVLAASTDFIQFMHEHKMRLNDFKAANVMLTPDHRVYFLDFGLVTGEAQRAGRGTPMYFAPERLFSSSRPCISPPASDWYTLGLVLFEMLNRQIPFEDGALSKCYQQIRAGLSKDVLPPGPLGELVGGLVHVSPQERWDWRQICEWVAQYPVYNIPPITKCSSLDDLARVVDN